MHPIFIIHQIIFLKKTFLSFLKTFLSFCENIFSKTLFYVKETYIFSLVVGSPFIDVYKNGRWIALYGIDKNDVDERPLKTRVETMISHIVK